MHGIKKNTRICAFILSILAVSFFVVRIDVHAAEYGSWVSHSDSGYGVSGVTPSAEVDSFAADDNPSSVEKVISGFIAGVCDSINKGFQGSNGDDPSGGNKIDASFTGIVMGRLVNGVSYFVFDLTDNNIYGRVGATIYVILRILCLSLLFVFVLYAVVRTLYTGDVHGLSELKKTIYSAIFTVVMIYLMPQIVDWLCEVRDQVSVILLNALTSTTGGGNLSDTVDLANIYRKVYDDNPTFANALVYFMVSLIPIVFIVSYVKIAIQQVMLFGLFPVFSLVGYNDKKGFSTWVTNFFTNIFIPALDLTLIILPSLLVKYMEDNGMSKNGALKAVMVVTMMMSVVVTRNQLLSLLGNSIGVSGMGLFAPIGAAAGAAAAAVRAGVGKARAGRQGLGGENTPSQASATAQDVDAKDALQTRQQELKEISSRTGVSEENGGAAVYGAGSSITSMDAISPQAPPEPVPSADSTEGIEVPSGAGESNMAFPVPPEDSPETQANAPVEVQAEAVGSESIGGAVPAGVSSDAENGAYLSQYRVSADDVSSHDEYKELYQSSVNAATPVSGLSGDPEIKISAMTDANTNIERAANLQTIDNMSAASADLDRDTASQRAQLDTLRRENASRDEEIAQSGLAVAKHKETISEANENLNALKAENSRARAASSDPEHYKMAPDLQKRMDTENKRISDARSAIGREESRQAQAKAEKAANNKAIAGANAKITQNNSRQKSLQSEIKDRKQVETNFAQSAASSGRGEAKTFTSAAQFKDAMDASARQRSLINHKNFDSQAVSAYTTPHEKVALQRQHERKAMRAARASAVATGAFVAASEAGVGVAAVGAAVGGSETMTAVANGGGNVVGARAYADDASTLAAEAVAGASAIGTGISRVKESVGGTTGRSGPNSPRPAQGRKRPSAVTGSQGEAARRSGAQMESHSMQGRGQSHAVTQTTQTGARSEVTPADILRANVYGAGEKGADRLAQAQQNAERKRESAENGRK